MTTKEKNVHFTKIVIKQVQSKSMIQFIDKVIGLLSELPQIRETRQVNIKQNKTKKNKQLSVGRRCWQLL